ADPLRAAGARLVGGPDASGFPGDRGTVPPVGEEAGRTLPGPVSGIRASSRGGRSHPPEPDTPAHRPAHRRVRKKRGHHGIHGTHGKKTEEEQKREGKLRKTPWPNPTVRPLV